jgi:hypothetical protein
MEEDGNSSYEEEENSISKKHRRDSLAMSRDSNEYSEPLIQKQQL